MKCLVRFLYALTFLFVPFAVVYPQSAAADVPIEWQTAAERTNYQQTPRYPETIEFGRRLDAASDLILYESFGTSGEGRELPLLIAAADGDFTPSKARRNGKAVILIQAAIHSGESDGKDAGLALLRDIAITKIRRDLLDHSVILFIPIYNVDGHELFTKYNRINQNGPAQMGFRATSANQNLNRDYMKADTPETRAWLKLWNAWKPDFFIDCHVTDGADFRYNITYEFAHHAEISDHLKKWMYQHFENLVVPQVESEGNLLTHYIQLIDTFAPQKGIVTFIATPRFATGYTPLRNRNGLLIEAHSLKPYQSRVRGTYDVLRYTIEEIGKNKRDLFEANRRADEETVENGKKYQPGIKFPLVQRPGNFSREFNFKGYEFQLVDSPISGAKKIVYKDKPVDLTIPQYDFVRIEKEVSTPLYYIIPPQWRDVIERLDLHGVDYRRLPDAREFEVESYRFEEPKWADFPFEGRLTVSFKTVPIKEKRRFPKNSVIVPLDQENARVAINWLEPEAPDSAMFWGFFNAVFEQKEYSESYIMEDIAAEMLKRDADLRKEFEKMLEDEEFAKSPRARLNYFYRRSPYYDQRIGVYPVGKIVEKISF
jgi:hypothetical protein